MGAEDEMVFAAEKESAGMKNWIIIGVVIVLIGLASFWFLTNPKNTGFFDLSSVNPNGSGDSADNGSNASTADKPFWESFIPIASGSDPEDEAFTDIPLQADWTLREHELTVDHVDLTLSSTATVEDTLSKKTITENSILVGFTGNIKLTSEGIVLSGTIDSVKGTGSETAYNNPESVIVTTEKISSEKMSVTEFAGTVSGTFTFPKAAVTVENEPVSFKGFVGQVIMEKNHLQLNGKVDSFTTKTSQGSITVK